MTVREEITRRLVKTNSEYLFGVREIRALTELSVKLKSDAQDWITIFVILQPSVSTLEVRLAEEFASLIPWNLIAKAVLDEITP